MKDNARWDIGIKQTLTLPNLDNPGETYLRRYRLFRTPWLGVYLHRMDGPDSRPTLHDHPWNILCLVLRGGYLEKRLNPDDMSVFVRVIRRINWIRTHDAHAILDLHRTPTWTLVFMGKRVRTWGYWEKLVVYRSPDGMKEKNWVWTEHSKHLHQRELDKAMAARRKLQDTPWLKLRSGKYLRSKR